MKRIILLGASGSIGTQTLDIIEKRSNEFTLVGFSVGYQADMAEVIYARFPSVQAVCLRQEIDAIEFKDKHENLSVLYGDSGLLDLINETEADMVVNALVGFVGLVPTITALKLNREVATANKESLVVGGKLVNDLLDQGHGKLYPIDSEHVAIAKLLAEAKEKKIDKILITGSGGALRNVPLEELPNATPDMALAHPNWKMGKKITIDCATMMNKGFELIEACVLFRRPMEDFEILMHDESMVHSAIRYRNHRYLCDISVPDMHGPIEYALEEGKGKYEIKRVRSLKKLKKFHFHDFDPERYPSVEICKKAYEKGGNAPAILNASNEVAVEAFLNYEIAFTEIPYYVEKALKRIPFVENPTLEDLLFTDSMTRGYTRERINLDKR